MRYFWRLVDTYSVKEFNCQINEPRTHNIPFYQQKIDINLKNIKFCVSVQRYGKTTNIPAESMKYVLKNFIGSDVTILIISINK